MKANTTLKQKEIGLSETSEGKAYKNRIAYYTTLPLTAQEIHTVGLEEVKNPLKMEGIIAEVFLWQLF